MSNPFRFVNRRLAGAAAVSGALLVPLGVFGSSALAHPGKSGSAQYQYRVTICHHTGSKKHPWHTITISNRAVAAHLLHHGDTLGACASAPPKSEKHHGKPTTTASTTGQSTTGQSGSHGKSDDDHGNANGHHGK